MPVDSQFIGIIVVKCSIFQLNSLFQVIMSDMYGILDAQKKPAISDGLFCYYLKKLNFCCLFAAFAFALFTAAFLARTFAVIVFAFAFAVFAAVLTVTIFALVAISLFSRRAAALGYALKRGFAGSFKRKSRSNNNERQND